jgi:hypothetical protein
MHHMRPLSQPAAMAQSEPGAYQLSQLDVLTLADMLEQVVQAM